MKLITGDLHLTDNSRDNYRLDFLQRRLPKLAHRYDVSTISILGDLTTKKDFHGSWLVNTIVDSLTALVEKGIEVEIICGNHDYHANIDNPFFQFMDYLEGIRFYNRPYQDLDTLYLPHTRNPERDWADIDFEGVKLILTHNTFAGALGEANQALRGIPLNLLPRSIQIVSGDVHPPQQLENATYVGAPYTINFGDVYQPRVLLLDKGRQTSIPLKGPAKRVVAARSLIELKRLLSATGNEDIIRIELVLQQSDYPKWAELQAEARRLLNGNRRLDSIIPVVEANRQITAQRRNRGPISDEKLVRDYCQDRGTDNHTTEQGVELL